MDASSVPEVQAAVKVRRKCWKRFAGDEKVTAEQMSK